MSQIEDNNKPPTPEPMRIRNLNQPISKERLIDFDELDNKILEAINQNKKASFNFLSAYDKEYIKNKLKHPDDKKSLENPGAFYPSVELLNEIKAAESEIPKPDVIDKRT